MPPMETKPVAHDNSEIKKNGCQISVWPHSTENCSNYFPQVHPFNLTLHSGLQCLPNIVRCFLRVALAQDL